MAALTAIVVFLVVLNSTFVVVNQLGVGSPYQFTSQANVNITAIQSAGACSYNATSGNTNCAPNFGNLGGVLSTLVTFGDFLWALAKMVIFLPMVVGLPAIFLIQDFYAPVLIAGLYNLVVWIILIFWFNQLISGRYQFEVD
jgi:hypothetical protein